MIFSKIYGGLGNQMFQYAVGRRLAHLLGVDLKLDISWFKNSKFRTYALGCFNVQASITSMKAVQTEAVTKQGVVGRLVRYVLGGSPNTPIHIRERHYHFDPEILQLGSGIYLDGHWQSEKYFADIAGIIREEFTVRTPQTGKNKYLAELITSCESVSLHIRRGDYVSSLRTSEIHGTCDPDYYSRCVACLTQMVRNPHFFVFSDEPEWARDTLKLSHPTTVVDHNGEEKNYEDLRLMSQCHYHIIANSTFSWWGAWLNQNQNKIVLAPKRWFRSDVYDSKDLIPDEWIKV